MDSLHRHGKGKRASTAILTLAAFVAVLAIDQGIYTIFFPLARVASTTGRFQTSGDLRAQENVEGVSLLQRKMLLRSLPIVMSGPLPGGIGNQLEVVYEQINIVHKNNFEYYFPPIIPRENGDSIPAAVAWDLTNLRKRLPRVHTELPAACDSKKGGMWDVNIEASKERVKGKSNQAKTMELHGYRNETLVFKTSRYGLEDFTNLRQNMLDALLRHSQSSLFVKDSNRSAICLWVGIHSAQTDISFAPLLRPNLRIQRLAMQWPLEKLGVVHFRFDEHICGAGPPPGVDASRHVCVLQVGASSTKWVPVSEYAQKVSRKLAANGVTTAYLTRSKYMPEDTWNNIENAFRNANVVKIAESAWGRYDNVTLNFLERELATRCRYFLAEARSTWSKTVETARLDSTSTYKVIDLF